jgi:hypothetical protein
VPQWKSAGRSKENIRDKTGYSHEFGSRPLVETNSKMGVLYGNKFLLAAIILRCNSRPGCYNLSKTNHRSAGIRRLVRLNNRASGSTAAG